MTTPNPNSNKEYTMFKDLLPTQTTTLFGIEYPNHNVLWEAISQHLPLSNPTHYNETIEKWWEDVRNNKPVTRREVSWYLSVYQLGRDEITLWDDEYEAARNLLAEALVLSQSLVVLYDLAHSQGWAKDKLSDVMRFTIRAKKWMERDSKAFKLRVKRVAEDIGTELDFDTCYLLQMGV